jgi:hypothetical protein
MNTCTNAPSHTAFGDGALRSLRRTLGRLLDALKQGLKDSAERRIDEHFQRERDARERHLAHAGDHYELERMERDWDRRRADFWRVF